MFFVVFILFFFLGLCGVVKPRFSLVAGLILALSFPFGNHYTTLHYFNGISAIDGFFLGLMPLVFKIILETGAIVPRKIVRRLFILTLIFATYFVVALVVQNRNLIMVLKELRPLIHFLEFGILLIIARNTRFTIFQGNINLLAILAGMSNLIYFSFGYFGYTEFEDVYYQVNSNRYIDISTYFSIYYILHQQYRIVYLNERKEKDRWALFVSVISVLVTNSRVMLLATIVGVGILRSKTLVNRVKYLFWAVIILYAFVQFSIYIGQERIVESLSQEGFTTQIVQRFSPAILPIMSMDIFHVLFGYGLGYYFEIPWFGYREIDPVNISIDTAYLTHFVKQGVIGMVVLLISLRFLSFTNHRRLSSAFLVFWLIQFLVEASLYQNTIYGATLFLFLYHKNQLSMSNERA